MNSGEMATIQCAVTKGDLPVEISWSLNEKPINPIDGIVITKTSKRISSLSIESVEEVHAGNYTCLAKNKAGKTSHTAVLKINGDFVDES